MHLVDKMVASKAVVPYDIHGDGRKIHTGQCSHIHDIESDLLHAVFELREECLQVNTQTMQKEAS